jgi:hypothetical protein
MSSVVVRFPDGSREFRFPEKMLEVGDVVWHDGEPFRVVHVTGDDDTPVVTVEPESDELGDILRSERGGVELMPVE